MAESKISLKNNQLQPKGHSLGILRRQMSKGSFEKAAKEQPWLDLV